MNVNKHLIIDYMPFEFSRTSITEGIEDPNKPFMVKGVLQRADAKNWNGRVYPYEMLVKESQKYADEFIKERRAMGELDHPRDEVVNLKNVSHNIVEMHWEGKDLIGTLEVLPTPSGNILRKLFEANIRLGISSRGMGTIQKNIKEGVDVDVVQDDYNLICFDMVSSPSTKGAFMYALNEGVVHNPVDNKWTTAEIIIREFLSTVG
jgi:hypothetical protein